MKSDKRQLVLNFPVGSHMTDLYTGTAPIKAIAPSEATFWEKPPRPYRQKFSDEEINAKYDTKAERIVTETNREKLPNFYESLKRPGYMDPRPFYQRRQRWDEERQSKLIESFLINIPIPPLFVYETRPNVYEVMDGQQRISAIKAFFSNDLVLEKLDRWPELNGRTYLKLPERIKAGIDRRSISWIVVLSESAENDEDAMSLKQLVFERLNTGGVKLTDQEIRNALHQGAFNSFLFDLAKNPQFRAAWGIPPYTDQEEKGTPPWAAEDSFYRKMEDIEMVLRFFALRHAEHYTRGMQGFLDLYMVRARSFTADDFQRLKELFDSMIETATKLYGDKLFVPFDVQRNDWSTTTQKAYADAVMVALSRWLPKSKVLIEQRDKVLEQTKEMFRADKTGTLTGRGNTKKDVLDRIELLEKLYAAI